MTREKKRPEMQTEIYNQQSEGEWVTGTQRTPRAVPLKSSPVVDPKSFLLFGQFVLILNSWMREA